MSRSFTPVPRRLLQAAATLLGLALLALPPAAVSLSGSAGADPLWTALRIAGLELIGLLTANVVLGAFRPFFTRLAKPLLIHRLHVALGMLAWALVLAHGASVVVFGTGGYPAASVWLGPATGVLLTVAIATALLRARLRGSWRHFHRLAYALVLLGVVHGSLLGTDLRSNRFLLGCAIAYAVAAMSGLVYRLTRPARRNHPPRGLMSPATGGPRSIRGPTRVPEESTDRSGAAPRTTRPATDQNQLEQPGAEVAGSPSPPASLASGAPLRTRSRSQAAATRRLRRERRTLELMVRMYCRHNHRERELCQECRALLDYALVRVDNCVFGSEKPVCSQCPIHCYRPTMRERIRASMRYAGPRMTWRHPYLAWRHLLDRRQKPFREGQTRQPSF